MMGSADEDSSEECIIENQDTSGDQLVSPDSPDVYDIFGEPQVLPRVGDEYQVEIPPLVTESEDLASSKLTVISIENNLGSSFSHHENLKLGEGQGCFPDSGSLSNSWSDFEQESFLLGLYIFGKNLDQVKNFMGSKEIGDILSFYYGKFYRSDGHLRWSECRKIRSKRCIHGHRIFTGWRQQALLARLLPRVSEEFQLPLLEVSRKFGDAKISLEEYVSTLKAKVGVAVLIEVIGIGKGKHDLTGIVTESPRVNQVVHTRPEVPVAKPFASLTYSEIVEFLTGNFRLSKTRANDLFWEAVWPRLLAKGWHSEEPKKKDCVRSKHSLVFLVPGIKKFSRRKLVKGSHYFNSVADVLNKVASKPRLVQLEIEQNGTADDEVDEYVTKVRLGKDRHPDRQLRCFLQPALANTNPDDIEFTVVDTSSVCQEKPGMVRKLRKLPNGPAPSISRKDDGGNCKQPADNLDSMDISSNDTESSSPAKRLSDRVVCSDVSSCVASVSKQGMPTKGLEPSNAQIDSPKEGNDPNKIMACQSSRSNDPELTNMPMDGKTDGRTKMTKCQFSRRRKNSQANSLAPITKRRRLTACSHDDSKRSTDSGLKEKELHLQLDSCKGSDGMSLDAASSHENVSTGSSAKGSPSDTNENGVTDNCVTKPASPEKSLPQTSIDLNHPSPDSDSSEKCSIKTENIQDFQNTDVSFFLSEANRLLESSHQSNTSGHEATAEEQPDTAARRHSTRNRPLTAKALEALACGFLTTKRKWRGMELA